MSQEKPPTEPDGATAIARERARQQSEEGYTREHDARHNPQQLIDAALAYTVQAQDRLSVAAGGGVGADGPESYWPWDLASFKHTDDEFRSLVKAGALIAAAYDAALAQLGLTPTNPESPKWLRDMIDNTARSIEPLQTLLPDDVVAVHLPEPTAPDFTGCEWNDGAAGWDVFAYSSEPRRGYVQVAASRYLTSDDATSLAAALLSAARAAYEYEHSHTKEDQI